jgi:hypothetical protein
MPEYISIAGTDLTRLLNENSQLRKQVMELQIHCSVKEEQLRAYRRMQCSQQQVDKLKQDLEETTARVLRSHGMEPTHAVLTPNVVNGVVNGK